MATNAGVVISATVHGVSGAATPGGPSEEEFVLTTDLNSYTGVTLAYAQSIIDYVSNTSEVVREINYFVRIANVTAPTPDYQQVLAGQPQAEARQTGTIGPSDYTTAASLKTVFDNAVASARATTSY